MKRLLRVVLGANLASFLHLLAFKPTEFLRACSRAFRAAVNIPTVSRYEIPWISLGEVLGDRRPVITMPVMQYEDGMLPSAQAMALLSILVAENPGEVLEIGTFMGHTTALMAENLPRATIHTVDLPTTFSPANDDPSGLPKDDFHLIEGRVVGREYKRQAMGERIKQHFADTATWDFREAGSPTFFFIDGSHTYEYCKNDSEKCFALCGGRAVFLWHDCDVVHPGVERLIAEWRTAGRDIKVIAGTPLAYWKNVSD